MKNPVWHQNNQEWMVMGLLGLAVLSVAYAGARWIRSRAETANSVVLALRPLAIAEPNEPQIQAALAGDKPLLEALKKDNLFAPAPKPQNPVTQVNGIIGHYEALINGQLLKAGDSVGDAKIVSVTADTVTVEWQGQTSTFSPIGAPDSGGAGPSPRNGASRPSRARSGGVVISSGAAPPEGVRVTSISAEERARLRSMSPEERRAFLQSKFAESRR